MIPAEDLLERLSAAARRAPVDDVELSFAERHLGASRFAASALTQSGVVSEVAARVRVALGGRIGTAITDDLDAAGLDAAVTLAADSARLQPPLPDFPGFARPDRRPLRGGGAWVEATAAFGPDERAAVLGRVFARAARDRLTCAGSFVTGSRQVAVVTRAGVARAHRWTEASLAAIALDGDASGHASFASGDIDRLDDAALADEACRIAVPGRDPIELPPDAYDVVLMPHAVAELVEWMSLTSFGARTVLDGTSLLAGRTGERLADPTVTILDDSAFGHPDQVGSPFDAEGVARVRAWFFDEGKAGEPVTDLQTGAKLGRGSTGHAPPATGFLELEGPAPAHVVMRPGDASVEDLIGRVERGLYVTRFHYVNGLLDTRRATMTGMTRDGTFLIEGGRIGPAIKNLRFTESILDAFGRVGGIGRDLQSVPTHWSGVGTYLTPPLLLRSFRFTGRSR